MEQNNIDHLFRHQFGKMVSILTRIFGLEHLETIEDAVQDTFITAIKAWQYKIPDNPEAWLTAAAKNRVIDLFRKIKAEDARASKLYSGATTLGISEMFSRYEIEDSQLRMIFTACHPDLNPKEQIAFALRTISGFSAKEISSGLLSSEETIKKRLQRARKTIKQNNIAFEIPTGQQLIIRRDRVLEVLYLIFNEGFHSNLKDKLVRKELCGEALRLIKLFLKKKPLRDPKSYALFALMCFHSARLESKINDKNEIIDIKNQNRKLWYFPLMILGSEAMNKSLENKAVISSYHLEAAIAAEHLRAPNYKSTNWNSILEWYKKLNHLQPSIYTKLNIAIVNIELNELDAAHEMLVLLNENDLGKRSYLYFGTLAEYYWKKKDTENALTNINLAIAKVNNTSEQQYLIKKREIISSNSNTTYYK